MQSNFKKILNKNNYVLKPNQYFERLQTSFSFSDSKLYTNGLTPNSEKKMSKDNETSKKKAVLKEVGWFALKTAAISGAVLGGVAIAVPAIGFTAGGVAAGSLAAAYQSAVLGGTIASGSAFAVLQSVGVLGLAAGTQAGVVAASAVTAGAHTAIKKLRRKKDGEGANAKNGGKDKVCSCGKVMELYKNDEDVAYICNCEKEKKVYFCAKVAELDKPKKVSETSCLTEHDCSGLSNCDYCVEETSSKNSPKKNYELKSEFSNESNGILNEATLESIEKWKNVELTDDVTITQHILKKI